MKIASPYPNSEGSGETKKELLPGLESAGSFGSLFLFGPLKS